MGKGGDCRKDTTCSLKLDLNISPAISLGTSQQLTKKRYVCVKSAVFSAGAALLKTHCGTALAHSYQERTAAIKSLPGRLTVSGDLELKFRDAHAGVIRLWGGVGNAFPGVGCAAGGRRIYSLGVGRARVSFVPLVVGVQPNHSVPMLLLPEEDLVAGF